MKKSEHVMRVLLVLTTILMLFGFGASAEAQSLDPTLVSKGLESTVFIKSERVFRGLFFPGFGTGFFVHPDGYIVTNWHVVANQVEARIDGETREVNTNVVSLEVVIKSGEPDERTIPATIVSLDRKRDLALLHVDHAAPAWLGIASPPEVTLAQPIWLIGYPLGDLLAGDMVGGSTSAGEIPNPSATINRGIVTSLRRDTDRRLRSIQIDAAVNPGNSGGPLLDLEGRVVGVVNAKISGAEGLGFAISGNLLGQFASHKSAKVTFAPTTVYRSPAKPISVTVEPILADLANGEGSVTLTAGGEVLATAALQRAEGIWTAEITVPELAEGEIAPEDYVAHLRFTSAGAGEVMNRRFRLRGSSAPLTVSSQRDPAKVLADRRVFSNEMSVSDYTKSGSPTGSKNRSLSDIAGTVKLNRSASGSVVIDDHTLYELTSPLKRNFPDERYANIIPAADRKLAKDYDVMKWVVSELESRKRAIDTYRRHSDWQVRREAERAAEKIQQLLPEARGDFEQLRQRIRHTSLVFCHDREQWFYRESCPCEAPENP